MTEFRSATKQLGFQEVYKSMYGRQQSAENSQIKYMGLY